MKSSGVWSIVPFLLVLVFVLPLQLEGDHDHSQTKQPILSGTKGSRSRRSAYQYNSGIPVGPNLSTCHASMTAPLGLTSHEVNCCPARPDSERAAKDFEFPSPSSPLRLRRPAHRLARDEQYVAKYNRAVALMKQLPADHPHSLARQANVHCLYCTGAYYQSSSDSTPLDIHRSWLFFPFHRFYVHFHERILGKLVGDDSFALPFWNYDSPDGMPIPDIYMQGELLDEDRDGRHLPPAPVAMDYSLDQVSDGNRPAAEQVATNLAVLYRSMVSGAAKPELFMGCRLRVGEEESCYGTVEASLHNAVHLWVGNKSKPEYEDMGAFYSAARDPVFFAHHAGIDRLWALWRRRGGYGRSEPEFDDPGWLDSYFYFYDENSDLVRARVRDAVDMDRLGYAYEEVGLPWLDARPEPSVPPKVARDILNGGENMLRKATNEGPWTLEETVRVQVARPKSDNRAKEEEEVLVVEGISVVKNGTFGKFDVYINLVDETMASPKIREYAGGFVSRQGESDVMKVGISEILGDLEADGDESIWVSLVPGGETGNVTSVDGIHIEYMQ